MAQIPQINNPITSKNYNYSPRQQDANTEPFDIVKLTGVGAAGVNSDSATRSRLEMGNRELIPLQVAMAKDPTLAVEMLKDLLNVEVLNQALITGHTELYGSLENLAKELYVTPEQLLQEIINQEQQNTMFSGHEFYDVLREVAQTTTDPGTKELIGGLLKSINFAQNRQEIMGALRANLKFLSEYYSPNEKLSEKLFNLSQEWGADDAEKFFDYLKGETLSILDDVSGSLLNDEKTQMLIPLIKHNLSRYNNSPYMCKEYFNLLMTQISSGTVREALKNSFNRLYAALFEKKPMQDPQETMTDNEEVYNENSRGENVRNSDVRADNIRNNSVRSENIRDNGVQAENVIKDNVRGENVRNDNNLRNNNNNNDIYSDDVYNDYTTNKDQNQPFLGDLEPKNDDFKGVENQNRQTDQIEEEFFSENDNEIDLDNLNKAINASKRPLENDVEPNIKIDQKTVNTAVDVLKYLPEDYEEADPETINIVINILKQLPENEGEPDIAFKTINTVINASEYFSDEGEEIDPETIDIAVNVLKQLPEEYDEIDHETINTAVKVLNYLSENVDETDNSNEIDLDTINKAINASRTNPDPEEEQEQPLSGWQKSLNNIMSERGYSHQLKESGYNIEHILASYNRGKLSGLDALKMLSEGLFLGDKSNIENVNQMLAGFEQVNTMQELIDNLNSMLRGMPDIPLRERLYGVFVTIIEKMSVRNELPQHGIRPPVSSTLDNLTDFIEKNINNPALKSLDSFNASNLLNSLLNAPGVFTPLAHYILPLDVDGTRAFGELWVDNDENNPNNTPGTQRNYHLFLTFDVESIGRFELDMYALGEEVNLSLLYPSSFEKAIEPFKDRVNKIVRSSGYQTRAFETAPLRKPHNLVEVFPKITEKRTTLSKRV